MKAKASSLKKMARLAGVLYLALILSSLYSHWFVPSKIFVRGNAVATTNNILANEFLFRTSVIVSLLEMVIFLFLVLVLFRLFKQVNHQLSIVMVALAG